MGIYKMHWGIVLNEVEERRIGHLLESTESHQFILNSSTFSTYLKCSPVFSLTEQPTKKYRMALSLSPSSVPMVVAPAV
jgi:hypothetical protein